MCKLGVISEERLKIEVKLLLSANRKSYTCMPRRLPQQRMTSSDHESPFHASRAISAVAELLVIIVICVIQFRQLAARFTVKIKMVCEMVCHFSR